MDEHMISVRDLALFIFRGCFPFSFFDVLPDGSLHHVEVKFSTDVDWEVSIVGAFTQCFVHLRDRLRLETMVPGYIGGTPFFWAPSRGEAFGGYNEEDIVWGYENDVFISCMLKNGRDYKLQVAVMVGRQIVDRKDSR